MSSSPSKLKKRPPLDSSSGTSRTMEMALSHHPSGSSSLATTGTSAHYTSNHDIIPTTVNSRSSQAVGLQPQTATEQYWAARAVKAEALLVAQDKYQKELRSTVLEEEMKRQKQVRALNKGHKEKHASLEKLLAILLAFVGLLVLLVIYLSTHYTKHSFLMQKERNWWSAIGTSHFTIPILSPFTSVVEHESSVFGSKLLATLAAVAACLGYFIFRFWFTHSTQRQQYTSSTTSRAIHQ